MQTVRIDGLPADPLDAAAAFHADHVPALRAVADDLLIVWPLADHTHRGWRLAAVQELARVAAPRRVNAVAGRTDAAISAAARYLAAAPGLTGQVLLLDDEGAGPVVASSA